MRLSNIALVYGDGVRLYRLKKNKGKYTLLSMEKFQNLEDIKEIKYIAIWDDDIPIKKVEIPKTKNRKFIEHVIKKDLSKDVTNIESFSIRYKVSKDTDLNRELNVYLHSDEKFYTGIPVTHQESVRVYTIIPFCLAFFNRELNQKKVLHMYVDESKFLAVYTIDSSVEFIRVVNLDKDTNLVQQIYENIVLTYRYVSLNISPLDVVMFSGNIFIISTMLDSLSETIRQGISVLNYKYYVDLPKGKGNNSDEFISYIFDIILVIGLLNLDRDYNFLPENIQVAYQKKLIYQISAYVILFLNLVLSLEIYSAAVNFFDKREELYKKARDIYLLDQYLQDVSNKNNIHLLYAYFLNQKEKQKQIKNLKKITEEIEPFGNENFSKIVYNYNRPMLTFAYSKNFRSYKELDLYMEGLKNKKGVVVEKVYKTRSINVSVTVE